MLAGTSAVRRADGRWYAAALAFTAAAVLVAVAVGPAGLPVGAVLRDLVGRLPLVSVRSGLSPTEHAILWQFRLPRIVLGLLVGGLLSCSGAAYQGVFRNPLADPFLLGSAAGAGFGATLVIVYGGGHLVPLAAFIGAIVAVACAYAVGTKAAAGSNNPAPLLLAGVAVAAMFTALQTFVQQRHTDSLREVYSWLLGRLNTANWHDVTLVLPYSVVSVVALIASRRLLDVLRVGELEASSVGVDVRRLRLAVIGTATLAAAAAVAVAGLIGLRDRATAGSSRSRSSSAVASSCSPTSSPAR
jgi:iron complex transport system permease protein